MHALRPATAWPLLLGLMAIGAGCRTGGAGSRGVTTADGVYEFIARTGRNDLRGTLLWMSGEASVDSEIGYCRSDPLQTSLESRRFICETGHEFQNLTYIIDLHNPLNRSRWRATVQQTRQRQVCVRYEVRNGRQVCVQYRTETYEVTVPVGGPLTFNRRS